MTIAQDELFMCAECRKKSGYGQYIKVTYINTGGWSPSWEGRVCEHVTATDVMEYFHPKKETTK